VLDALERCRVPTIAAIAGACTGGGFALRPPVTSASARDARFGLPIARTLGNCLSWPITALCRPDRSRALKR
jgi:enoyl-CoA hydratase/carnithine racemase